MAPVRWRRKINRGMSKCPCVGCYVLPNYPVQKHSSFLLPVISCNGHLECCSVAQLYMAETGTSKPPGLINGVTLSNLFGGNFSLAGWFGGPYLVYLLLKFKPNIGRGFDVDGKQMELRLFGPPPDFRENRVAETAPQVQRATFPPTRSHSCCWRRWHCEMAGDSGPIRSRPDPVC